MSQSLDKFNLMLLLAQMTRNRLLVDTAMKNVEPEFFNVDVIGGSPTMAMMFSHIRDNVRNYNVLPDVPTFCARIVFDFATRQMHQLVQQAHIEIGLLLQLVAGTTNDALPHARAVLSSLVDHCKTRPETQRLLARATMGEISSSELSKQLDEQNQRQNQLNGGLAVTGLSTIQIANEDLAIRMRTYIAWVDARFGKGKGMVNGTLLSIIAPQGGGKTTMGVDMCVQQACNGRDSALFFFEEGLTPAVRRNIWSAALGIPTDVQEQFEGDILKAAESLKLDQALIVAKMGMIDRHLHIVDLVDKPSASLDTVTAEIEFLIASGRRPSLCYIDWAGPIARRMMAKGFKGRKFDDDENGALLAISYELAGHAETHKYFSVISHQMAVEIAKKGPYGEHDMYCGARCRSFTEPCKYVLVLGPQDKQNQLLQKCTVAKARNDPPAVFIIQRQGPINGFLETTSHEIKGRRFVKKNVDSTAVPQVK